MVKYDFWFLFFALLNNLKCACVCWRISGVKQWKLMKQTKDILCGFQPHSNDSSFQALATDASPGCFSLVQFSRSVVSDSFRPHELQHARPPCPSSTPRVHSNSRPSSQWCHPAISSSVVPFSSCPQSLPASVFSNESTLRMRVFAATATATAKLRQS